MTLFSGAYRGRRVLVTGHTGFKGSWLALWLRELGAEVAGIAIDPWSEPDHWSLLDLPVEDHRVDVRDGAAVAAVFDSFRPEVVFHLAAQPLVRRSYRDPVETWSTNVVGTANVLEAVRHTKETRAVVVVTTDKCYENREWVWGYRESDALGGHDHYSASKAGTELVAASFRSASFTDAGAPLIATARAGNVIGGGDWAEDRLIPDVMRAVSRGDSLEIRSPQATRPWQHVLEALSGYLVLGERMLAGDRSVAEAWNFGPDAASNRTVSEVLEGLRAGWDGIHWHLTGSPQPHEANLLYLDSSKARQRLDWWPVWDLATTVARTSDWYRAWQQEKRVLSTAQIGEYVEAASSAELPWARS